MMSSAGAPRRLSAVLCGFALVSLLDLAGCATSGPAFHALDASEKRAVVYFYRPSKMAGSMSPFKIFVNGTHVTNLSNGGYFAREAPAGELAILAQIKPTVMNFGVGLLLVDKPQLVLPVKPGQTRFIRFEFGSLGGPKLQEVPEDVAMREIVDCHETESLEP